MWESVGSIPAVNIKNDWEKIMGLFSKKKEPLTEDDRNALLFVMKEDKIRWERTFPIPCPSIDWTIENIAEGKELTSEDKEACMNAIKRYLSSHNDSEMEKTLKEVKKKL